MNANLANYALLCDSICTLFFMRLSGSASWRVMCHEDQARIALHRLGGMAATW